ncbi:hypothetical protein ASPFODRAFT_54397 [Aspergillus luchuensis CBS 106.47]|uniref:PNPLA domain-containing protein n=1 Tax=Aspergillus luchuensis (strain CBS 106.47) TaxID=1137211 RepID=A0A1M3SZE5_ASPLC|nr:hypothetical protein ASPFODRAFT_54397 [Aspergillus luchuensis CBS 106.47]
MLGQRARGVEYHRDLALCPLCQGALQLTVRQLPPTKRPVVLALDGGGIRGMVTLGLLRALEQRLAGAITLPEIPDLTAGTSVEQVPYNNTSAAEACRRFPDLAQCIFQPGYFLSHIWPWLGCILNLVRDGAYDSGALERTLQQVCQPGRRVFDVMPPVAAGRRLAIVASRTSDGKPVVFPNYRGVRHRAVDSAYQRIVSHGASQNPLLRKAVAELAKEQYTVPDELVRAVLATCFFFELDEGPTRVPGQYVCRGSVLCARREPRRILERVLVEFPGAELQTGRGEHLGRSEDDDGCMVCGYYRKKVRFHVASLDEEISIMFKGSSGQQPIGGFPATVRQCLHLQQSDAVFGRSDHQIDQWPPQRMCYCLRGVKRVRFAEPAPSRKKRRV